MWKMTVVALWKLQQMERQASTFKLKNRPVFSCMGFCFLSASSSYFTSCYRIGFSTGPYAVLASSWLTHVGSNSGRNYMKKQKPKPPRHSGFKAVDASEYLLVTPWYVLCKMWGNCLWCEAKRCVQLKHIGSLGNVKPRPSWISG